MGVLVQGIVLTRFETYQEFLDWVYEKPDKSRLKLEFLFKIEKDAKFYHSVLECLREHGDAK